MPKAYIIAEIDIPDIQAYRDSGYMAAAEAAVAAHGGRYIVRGSPATILEGTASDTRIVVLEFPTRTAAETFYEGREYAPARKLRQSLSAGRLILLDGTASE